jgi:formylglycine-generating enzyme required for sulfatase activity
MDEDAGCTEIAASSYDQSCKSDSDCVLVHVGSACGGCVFACGQNVGAVNAAATAQYIADVAKTPAGVGYCFCRFEAVPAPCCRDGQCHADDECSPLDGSTAAYAGPIEGDASTDAGSPASCAPGGPGMTNCGPGGSGTESCCTSLEVTGGTFYRTYDEVFDDAGLFVNFTRAPDAGPAGEADPATVTSFRLDKYDVTVGRFRQFAAAWSNGWRPPAASGKHTHLNGGKGLANSAPPGTFESSGTYESGWVTDFDQYVLSPTNLTLGFDGDASNAGGCAWTAVAGSNESLPMNCAPWFDAYAFCIWDGGFLPSDAEWGYAAAGGNQQREYPWGSTEPGTNSQYAIYGCDYPNSVAPDGGACEDLTSLAPVGTAMLGAGRWGQLDLAGNLWQWTMDQYMTYVTPCTDCAYLTTDPDSDVVARGGSAWSSLSGLLPPTLFPHNRLPMNPAIGFRCARSP